MSRFFKVVLLVMLMCPLEGALDHVSWWQTAEQEVCGFVADGTHGENSQIDRPSLPLLAVAEIGSCVPGNQVGVSRIPRIVGMEYLTLSKNTLQRLAERTTLLSLHREPVFEAVVSHFCCPGGKHHVFALRKILI